MSFREVPVSFGVAVEGGVGRPIASAPGVVFDVLWQGPSTASTPGQSRIEHGTAPNQYRDYREWHLRFDTSAVPATVDVLRASLEVTLTGSNVLALDSALIGVYPANVTGAPGAVTVGDWHEIGTGNPSTNPPLATFPLTQGQTGTLAFQLPGSVVERGGFTSFALGWERAPRVWGASVVEWVTYDGAGGVAPPRLTVVKKAFMGGGSLL